MLRNLKHFIGGLLLFILQIHFVFNGKEQFGMYINPVLLLIVSLAIPVYYLRLQLRGSSPNEPVKKTSRKIILAIAIGAGLLVCGIMLRHVFLAMPDPERYSDVLPQLEALYSRFSKGEQPYYPVGMYSWAPFPVYMPLHWMPMAIPGIFGMDVRWIGFIFFAGSAFLYGHCVHRKGGPLWKQVIVALLPAGALFSFLEWSDKDMGATFEIIIAAYYLVLACGLQLHKLALVTAGIIMCLLSRYTMVFWVPMFAVLLWQERPVKQNIMVWGAVIAAVLLLYVLPFCLRDPGIFLKGISYHNGAAIAEWHGYGNPAVSRTHMDGIYFAPHLKEILSGDAPAQVLKARMIQGGLMILLSIIGIGGYSRIRRRVSFFDFSLMMLYTFVLFFYMFGPLTFRYYWISLLMISAVLCSNIMLHNGSRKDHLPGQSKPPL